MSIVDGQVRNGIQRSKVGLLTLCLRRILGAARHTCREIPDSVDLMAWQQTLGQLSKVEPAIGRSAQGAVVEIEAVNVDVGADETESRKS